MFEPCIYVMSSRVKNFSSTFLNATKASNANQTSKELLRHSWVNFVLFLPMDGSKGGDISTIVS